MWLWRHQSIHRWVPGRTRLFRYLRNLGSSYRLHGVNFLGRDGIGQHDELRDWRGGSTRSYQKKAPDTKWELEENTAVSHHCTVITKPTKIYDMILIIMTIISFLLHEKTLRFYCDRFINAWGNRMVNCLISHKSSKRNRVWKTGSYNLNVRFLTYFLFLYVWARTVPFFLSIPASIGVRIKSLFSRDFQITSHICLL